MILRWYFDVWRIVIWSIFHRCTKEMSRKPAPLSARPGKVVLLGSTVSLLSEQTSLRVMPNCFIHCSIAMKCDQMTGKKLRKQDTSSRFIQSVRLQRDSKRLRFVGFAEFDMDGRAFTGGEMDRMMMILALRNCFCNFGNFWCWEMRGLQVTRGQLFGYVWIYLFGYILIIYTVVMFAARVLFHMTTNHSPVSYLSYLQRPKRLDSERERESFPRVLSWAPPVQSPFPFLLYLTLSILSIVKSGG